MADRLTELQELTRAATPGPWRLVSLSPTSDYVQTERGVYADMCRTEDAQLTAAVRNALPALLDVAEAARKYVSHWTHQESTDPAWNQLRRALARLNGGDGAT